MRFLSSVYMQPQIRWASDSDGPVELFVAAGHVFGNAAGPITGKLVSQMLLGKAPDIDMTDCRWDRELDPIAPGASVHW